MKRSIGNALDEIVERLSVIEEKASEGEQKNKLLEDKLFELKAVCYLTLVMVAILLFLVLGVLMKALGF